MIKCFFVTLRRSAGPLCHFHCQAKLMFRYVLDAVYHEETYRILTITPSIATHASHVAQHHHRKTSTHRHPTAPQLSKMNQYPPVQYTPSDLVCKLECFEDRLDRTLQGLYDRIEDIDGRMKVIEAVITSPVALNTRFRRQ